MSKKIVSFDQGKRKQREKPRVQLSGGDVISMKNSLSDGVIKRIIARAGKRQEARIRQIATMTKGDIASYPFHREDPDFREGEEID